MNIGQLEAMLKITNTLRGFIKDAPLGMETMTKKIDDLEREIHELLKNLIYEEYKEEKRR